ncbi:hypothetical protein AN958_09273 [Leucoagaricus sp. SymC.cos]|nr:hypothetical protein AN958_09273 [Leucoagaricus sp. SymC.cos]
MPRSDIDNNWERRCRSEPSCSVPTWCELHLRPFSSKHNPDPAFGFGDWQLGQTLGI